MARKPYEVPGPRVVKIKYGGVGWRWTRAQTASAKLRALRVELAVQTAELNAALAEQGILNDDTRVLGGGE